MAPASQARAHVPTREAFRIAVKRSSGKVYNGRTPRVFPFPEAVPSLTSRGVSIDTARAHKAVTALRAYQTGYPDYDAQAWLASISEAFKTPSVRRTAAVLAERSRWSLRGVEITREDIAEIAAIGKGSVNRAVRRMEAAGFLVVARRPPMSDGTTVWQHPNSYRLVIPGGPVWGMTDTGVIGWGDESPYSVDHFSQETPDCPAWEQPTEWDRWVSGMRREFPRVPYSVDHFSQETHAIGDVTYSPATGRYTLTIDGREAASTGSADIAEAWRIHCLGKTERVAA